ncbi:unnamed protein product [Symbiodinium sp. CCMP2456]|nr:unnamed protein product [Symbiodinium sp. CCMP2456]
MMMSRASGQCSAILAGFLLLSPASTESGVRVDPTTQSFVDSTGRSVLFHGINVVGKNSRKEQELSDKQMDVMKDLGFNVARVGLSWDLYETKRSIFDETYLDFVEAQVNALGRRGILSFLDMHQDLLAKQYCGHGLPEWHMWPSDSADFHRNGRWAFPQPVAQPKYGPNDTYSGPYGRISNCLEAESGKIGWAGLYMTRALSNAAQLLYNNESGRLDAFAAFWRKVARRFRNNEYVLAYELINEPWLGDIFADPSLLVPSRADKVLLEAFYEKLHTAIRAEDNDTMIFFEPATGGNIFDTTHYGSDTTPGGAGFRHKTAFSYHIYCPWVQTDMPGTSSSWLKEWLCEKFNGWQFGIRAADTKRLKVAAILSEFGAVNASDPVMQRLLDFSMNAMDTNLHSWTYWYMIPREDGKNPEAPVLARTFARRVAGEIQSMSFDMASGNFTLRYAADPSIPARTEIFASLRHHYPRGLDYSLEPEAAGKIHQDGNLIWVEHAADLPQNLEVTVRVWHKAAKSEHLQPMLLAV